MKFDMTAAWNDAQQMLGANGGVLAVVAGVFFFLPYAGLMMLMGDQMQALEASRGANPDPEKMMQAVMSLYGNVWWAILLMAVLQGIGLLGLLTLLTDARRPTVGEALMAGARLFPSYIGAQLIQAVVLAVVVFTLFLLAALTGSVALGVLVGIALAVGVAYFFTKMLLVAPVIAIENQTNPLAALARSWRLTNGNSVRIFAFMFLLLFAVAIIGALAGAVLGFVFGLFGGSAATIGEALVSAALNATWVVVFVAVLAAIYRQLAGPSSAAISATFE